MRLYILAGSSAGRKNHSTPRWGSYRTVLLAEKWKSGEVKKDGKPVEKLAYSVPDAAYALSLSADYIWKLIYSGQLKSVKIGKRRLIPAIALKEFFESR